MNNYLIPANSKKSQLILGYFTLVDIVLFGFGCGLTLILLLIVQSPTVVQSLVIVSPALITGFLVMPVLYYHNVLQLIINVCTYVFNPKRYYWKGWCVQDESDKQ